MRKLTLALLLVLTSSGVQAAEWKLVWADEFDKPGLPDASKWTFEEGFIRNNEQQFYTRARSENARVENGMLVIEARKERFRNPAFAAAGKEKRKPAKGREFAEYTSASVTTSGNVSWTNGRIEVRAKLPTGRGTWPAIWMLGNSGAWPACGEIDIMENVGFNPDVIHANFHTKKYNHMIGTGKGSKITIPKPYEDFHVYAVEWRPDRLDFLVDKTNYFTFKNEGKGDAAWPYGKPQYLILNIAIGGAWGGQKGIDDSIFPQQMYIDYVRVYQEQNPAPARPLVK
jgi:beta-glucanase (GH16 family)